MSELITEEWLRSAGFKWEEVPRSTKHWLLWLGEAIEFTSPEDLGLELCHGGASGDLWFTWIRADYAGRYSRLLHIRHMTKTSEIVALIEGMTGIPFVKEDVMYGSLRSPKTAARLRMESEQLHHRLAREFGRSYASDAGVENDESKRGLLNE